MKEEKKYPQWAWPLKIWLAYALLSLLFRFLSGNLIVSPNEAYEMFCQSGYAVP